MADVERSLKPLPRPTIFEIVPSQIESLAEFCSQLSKYSKGFTELANDPKTPLLRRFASNTDYSLGMSLLTLEKVVAGLGSGHEIKVGGGHTELRKGVYSRSLSCMFYRDSNTGKLGVVDDMQLHASASYSLFEIPGFRSPDYQRLLPYRGLRRGILLIPV